MTTIIGVDFSGAGDNSTKGKTWLTKGRFNGEALTIDACESISRDGLEKMLNKLPDGAVAAMDFPFSVPMAFAEHLGHPQGDMPTLWDAVKMMDLDVFKRESRCFAECLRVGDLAHSNAQPCLHYGRPIMVNMTLRGMQMLHRLYGANRFEVPPLPKPASMLPVLLEVMPGAALKTFRLPYTRYKDGKDDADRQTRQTKRAEILRRLEAHSGVRLPNLDDIRSICVENVGGDALDSLVAAAVATRWAHCESDFQVPTDEVINTLKRNKRNKRQASQQALGKTKIETARVEGWIYVPDARNS